MSLLTTGTETKQIKRVTASVEIRPFHLEGLCGYSLNPQARDWSKPGP